LLNHGIGGVLRPQIGFQNVDVVFGALQALPANDVNALQYCGGVEGTDTLLHQEPQGRQRHIYHQRAETVAKSPTYRESFKKRRCLVPASGFYEWKRLDEKNKQPFTFDLLNGRMMAFAGLWDGWKDSANGQWLQIHDRMPVILHPSDYDRWLDRDSDSDRPPLDLLRPFPADEMEAFEVSKDVGNVKNNSPELLNRK